MKEDFVKRMITKDGNFRVTIYRDEYAENPRVTTDQPFHCDDWSRNYSIMLKCDDGMKSASDRIIHLLAHYGKHKEIINKLVENGKHMTDGKADINNALVYDRSNRRWVLMEWAKWFGEKDYEWRENEWFDGKKEDIDINYLLECCFDTTIDEFCNSKYWTDGVKIMSYSFGYNGDTSFSDTFDTDSTGLCWLEKDEFMKYSGCDEKWWKNKQLKDITFLISEIEAWADGNVYGYVIERRRRFKLHKEYVDGDYEVEDSDEEEWLEEDSCWGFYGDEDYAIDGACENSWFNKDELEDAA